MQTCNPQARTIILSANLCRVDFAEMSTSTYACLWALLGCLVASDSNLAWAALKTSKPRGTGKRAAGAQDQQPSATKGQNRQIYIRLAAYVAISGLIWSLAPTPALQLQPYYPTPSSRAEHDELSSNHHGQDTPPQDEPDTSDETFTKMIHNQTLGFEKIFVINLPERTDKRDAMSLTAALTDMKLTWTSALRGTSVPDKALPLGVDRAGWRDGGIGSWRSQMNVIRT